jgi:hypothetical protein
MDLNHGTEKETRARRMVAVKVTRKPGVAGFIGERKGAPFPFWRRLKESGDD